MPKIRNISQHHIIRIIITALSAKSVCVKDKWLMDGIAWRVFMVSTVTLASGALEHFACWWEVVATDKGCRPSIVRDVDVPVVKALELDRKGGPVQY